MLQAAFYVSLVIILSLLVGTLPIKHGLAMQLVCSMGTLYAHANLQPLHTAKDQHTSNDGSSACTC